MEVSLEVCRAIAVQRGMPLQFVAKEFFVFDVLSQISAFSATQQLVFKGGTALNKVYLRGLQRFSEDLDFDSGTSGLVDTRGLCKQLAEKIVGYEKSEFRRVKETIQFYCFFNSPLGARDHVRVDVAARKIVCEKPLVFKQAVSDFANVSVTGFPIYSLEDLVARKVHALATRVEGKDFYDVYNALPACGSMRKAVEKMLESEESDEDAAAFVEKAVERVKKADALKIGRLTNPFIPKPNRPPDWLELKNDLAALMEQLL